MTVYQVLIYMKYLLLCMFSINQQCRFFKHKGGGGNSLVRPRRPPRTTTQDVLEICKITTLSPFPGWANLVIQWDRKGIRFLNFFAKIKPNMKATSRLRRRTARSALWGSPLPLVKTQSGEPGSTVDRVGMVPRRR